MMQFFCFISLVARRISKNASYHEFAVTTCNELSQEQSYLCELIRFDSDHTIFGPAAATAYS